MKRWRGDGEVCVPTENIRIWVQAGKRSSNLWGARMEKEAVEEREGGCEAVPRSQGHSGRQD